jgi:hypothetical protein
MSKNKVSKFEEQYGPIADQMAHKYGLDPVLFRNQIRQESGFNPQARSGVGAVGIGQFMPGTAKQYNATPEQLMQNPQLALDIAAKHMRKLTDTYGDQRLALAAYNGGGGSIDFVKQKLGKKSITFEDWTKFNEDRRAKLGNSATAWHGQTLDYVKRITGGQQQNLASSKPSKQSQVPVAPPIVNTPPVVATKPATFDYHEARIKQMQGNPNKPEVPQSASQTPLLASGQPDPTNAKMRQIADEYGKLQAQRVWEQDQQKKIQEYEKSIAKRQLEIDRLSKLFYGAADTLQAPQQAPIRLQPMQYENPEVQMQNLDYLNYKSPGFGGFSG